MSQKLYAQLSQFQNKIQDKLLVVEMEEEKAVYNMLSELIKECHQLFSTIEEAAKTPSYQEVLLAELTEGEALMEELLEILEECIELPFKVMMRQKVYETIEDQMADLDDWIETLNESLDQPSCYFPYIESWDIGVFLEKR